MAREELAAKQAAISAARVLVFNLSPDWVRTRNCLPRSADLNFCMEWVLTRNSYELMSRAGGDPVPPAPTLISDIDTSDETITLNTRTTGQAQVTVKAKYNYHGPAQFMGGEVSCNPGKQFSLRLNITLAKTGQWVGTVTGQTTPDAQPPSAARVTTAQEITTAKSQAAPQL